MLEKQDNTIRISTCFGELVAETVYSDPEYPGIQIRLRRGEEDILIAWVEEGDREELDGKKELHAFVYANAKQDDYSHRIVFHGYGEEV